MKVFGTTAIAMALAASTALAQNASDDEMENNAETTQVESSTDTDQSAMNDSDMNNDSEWDKSSAEMNQMTSELIRTRDITGGAVYTTNEAHDEGAGWDSAEYEGVESEWNQIGEIEDLVMSKDGKLTGVVVEVGGFLDIGDKHVLLSVKDAKLVPVDDATYTFVTRFNEEEIEEMEGVDEAAWN